MFVPETYDPNVSHGLIVLAAPGRRGDGRDADDMVKIWDCSASEHNFIMVGPTAGQPTGWVAGEAEGVMEDLRWVRTRYTIDPKRIIAHGQGVGGQMAYYLGINKREVIRGAVPVGAVLASNPKDPVANQRVEFLVIAGAKDPLVEGDRRGAEEAGRKEVQGPVPRDADLPARNTSTTTGMCSARWCGGWTRWISSELDEERSSVCPWPTSASAAEKSTMVSRPTTLIGRTSTGTSRRASSASDVYLTSDSCVIAGRFFFIRGCIDIPIIETDEQFTWGVWVSIKEENFFLWQDHYETTRRSHLGPFFGWLSTQLPVYPETLHLKTMAHLRDEGIRPYIEVEHSEHPLALEQHEGMTLDRALEIVHTIESAGDGDRDSGSS